MQKASKIPFLFLCLFFALSGPAHSQMSLSDEKLVKVSLIAETDGVKPGSTTTIAIRQEITPEWHTYWSNPGDTGLATAVKWELPVGVTAADLKFPTPHKQATGALINYGYTDNVMILSDVTIPADLKIGDHVAIKAKVSLLVCKEICIPETTDVTLDLPVVESPTPGAWASAFDAVRKTLPQPNSGTQAVELMGDMLMITVKNIPIPTDQIPEEVYFFPHDGLLIQHAGTQALALSGRDAVLHIPLNKTRTTPIETVTGDIWFRDANGASSFEFSAAMAPEKKALAPVIEPLGPTTDTPSSDGIGFFAAIFSAFIGGIILNLMPCVFPVLSLKALGLVNKAHHDSKREMVLGGLIYLGGVLATFTLLGVVLAVAKAGGHHIGWGTQLQSPVFVAMTALLLFFIGLLLSGAVTIGQNIVGIGGKLAGKSGHIGTFFTGALAVIVATPCTAPFMGAAIFYGLTQPVFITLLVLWALGFGLAFPYVLLTLFPNVFLKFVPRPGVWMEHFKQFLAFPMWGAAIWLVWVLAQQAGSGGVLHVLVAMLGVGLGFWLWGTTHNRAKSTWQVTKKILAVLIVLMALVLNARQPMHAVTRAPDKGANYESFTPARLSELRAAGTPVFVNMTAAWCITCLANEKATLSTDAVRNAFKDKGIIYLKGDWTNFDASITEYLKSFGRSGVPIYVFYPKGLEPIVLPQILTPDLVITTLNGEK